MAAETTEAGSSLEKLDRRKFLGLAATAAGAMFIKPELVFGTAANSAVRVGLLGRGGRGTEDAKSLVETGGARVVALGDLFHDQLDAARAKFDQLQQEKGFAALDASQLFVGPRAYQQIAASKEVDAIAPASGFTRLEQRFESRALGLREEAMRKGPFEEQIAAALPTLKAGTLAVDQFFQKWDVLLTPVLRAPIFKTGMRDQTKIPFKDLDDMVCDYVAYSHSLSSSY